MTDRCKYDRCGICGGQGQDCRCFTQVVRFIEWFAKIIKRIGRKDEHGSTTKYHLGCRCIECTQANSKYCKQE